MDLSPDDPRSAVYVDLNAMTITLANGDHLSITNMFDDQGEECDPDEAVVVVAGDNDNGWWTVPLAWAEDETLH
jgi:hypothetical protein